MILITDDRVELSKPVEDWVFGKDENPESLAKEMIEFMYASGGVGLAASQVGLKKRLFVMKGDGLDYAFFNPRYTYYSDDEVKMEEGCLSFPGLFVNVKRPRIVRITFQDFNGDRTESTFTGITSRIVQHEMDHLDGVVWYDRANRYHLDKAFRKRKHGRLL